MAEYIAKGKGEKEEGPSLYDYFYYDYSILSKLLDLNLAEQFLTQNGLEFKNYWRAYLYFIELSIMDLYRHIERFINDYSINRFLTDYDDDFPTYIIENYLKKDPFVCRIYLLDIARCQLTKLRLKKEFTKETLSHELKSLQTVLDETNTYISNEYRVKRKNSDPAPINFPILNYLINIYGYNRYPNIPVAPYFRTLSRNILSPYIEKKLADPQKYFQGYTLFFFYLCNSFGANLGLNVKDTVDNFKDLRELHQIQSKIYWKNIEDKDRFATSNVLFEEEGKPTKKLKHFKKAITKFEQLEFLLGNSDVKVIDPYAFFGKPLFFSGGETKTDDLLLTVLYGELNRLKIGEKLEIIRFSHYIKNKMEDTWYSYAFYMNPGYWLIFDGITYDTGNLRYRLDYFLKVHKNEIEYTTLKIKDEFLRKYYKKKDRSIRFENYEKGIHGNMKGLLTEFAAVIYLLKIRNAQVTGIRTNTNNTDIDVMAKNVLLNLNFIVQAKTSLPVAEDALKHSIKEVNKHFKKISGYKIDGKTPIKILFFIGWSYPTASSSPEALIARRKLFLLNELRKNNVELASYEYLDIFLKYKKENNLNAIIKKVLGFEDGFVFD